ncbi:MAG: hypothetical protein JWR69_1049 [Pedosphaera sp.]|nr:hypothetical protein [Pedosphaera sp.]
MDSITVATFNVASNAEPLKHRLEEAHIPVEVHDESMMERLWFVARPLAGVRLKVHSRDFENALRLIHVWDEKEGVLRDAIRCPECRSSRVEYPQFTRKFFLPNLLGILAAIGLLEKEFYCQECQYTWPKEGTKKSATRPHMAPYYFIEGVQQPPPSEQTAGMSRG